MTDVKNQFRNLQTIVDQEKSAETTDPQNAAQHAANAAEAQRFLNERQQYFQQKVDIHQQNQGKELGMNYGRAFEDIAAALSAWAHETYEVDTSELWRTFRNAALSSDASLFWLSIPQELGLQFISIEGLDQRADDDELRLMLDRARDSIGPEFRAHWRALRMVTGKVDRATETGFWNDFLSEDSIRSSHAAAVVGPAVQRGDPHYIERLIDLQQSLPHGSQKRREIDELLPSVG